MPHLLSSWPPCEPLSPSSRLPPLLIAEEKGENPEQGREGPFPSPPAGWPCAPATPPTRSQRSLPAAGCAYGHSWPLALPERLLLRALWAPGPGRQHSNSAAAGTHARTREGVWGNLGQSLQISAGSLGVPRARRRSGWAGNCLWLGPSLPGLPLMRPRKLRVALLSGR